MLCYYPQAPSLHHRGSVDKLAVHLDVKRRFQPDVEKKVKGKGLDQSSVALGPGQCLSCDKCVFMWMKWHFSPPRWRGVGRLYAGKRRELVRRRAVSNDCCVWRVWSHCLAHEKAAIFMHHVSRSLIATGSWEVAISWCRRCNAQADVCLALLPGFHLWQLRKCCNSLKKGRPGFITPLSSYHKKIAKITLA